MTLTVSDRERHAYVNGDLQTLALLDQIELERDDVPDQSAAVKVHEDGWETNAWCLDRVIEALRTGEPLDQAQMRLLADELKGLVCRLPKKGVEELQFKARVLRICGLDEQLRPRLDSLQSCPRGQSTSVRSGAEQRA